MMRLLVNGRAATSTRRNRELFSAARTANEGDQKAVVTRLIVFRSLATPGQINCRIVIFMPTARSISCSTHPLAWMAGVYRRTTTSEIRRPVPELLLELVGWTHAERVQENVERPLIESMVELLRDRGPIPCACS